MSDLWNVALDEVGTRGSDGISGRHGAFADGAEWGVGWTLAIVGMAEAISLTYLCAGCECHLGPYERGPFVCGCAFFDEHVCTRASGATERHGVTPGCA